MLRLQHCCIQPAEALPPCPLPPPASCCRNEQLVHENRQQAVVIAELEARAISLAARLDAAQERGAALHRFAVAYGAAHGRLAAHAAGLHQQFARQLSGLLQLCRHLGLQLAAALAAADPLAGIEAGGTGAAAAVEEPAAGSGTADSGAASAAVAAAVLSIESVRTELRVAEKLLEMQAGSSEASELADVPASIAAALATDLAGLPPALLSSPLLEVPLLAPPAPACQPAAAAAAPPAGSQPSAAGGAAAAQGPAAAPGEAAAPSGLSTQVGQMMARLQSLAQGSQEQTARAAAAAQLHAQEQGERRRAQDLAAQLAARLDATQVGGKGW